MSDQIIDDLRREVQAIDKRLDHVWTLLVQVCGPDGRNGKLAALQTDAERVARKVHDHGNLITELRIAMAKYAALGGAGGAGVVVAIIEVAKRLGGA